ncbi:MAG TPA: F0F1 ATP synthase subunit delta [Gammaproteobacteria bacterium]|jgi:F-type H+-transporting ATPase subunit delta|nr:F0F1 ATP synthase subunit delta [Gammaproteobacteria bacterium]
MSELTTLARPYASAAFELAKEQQQFDHWSQMLAFMAAVAHDGTLRAVLDSPRLSEAQAAELFISICQERIDEQGRNFIKLLAENRRLTLLPEITALFEFMRREAEGKIDAEVVSAKEISQAQMEAITQALKARLGREVNVTARTDASLLGGAIIRAGDLVIDGSIRGRLNQLSTALSH